MGVFSTDPILTAMNYLPRLGSVNPANSIPDDYPTFLVSVNNPKSYAVISLVTVDLWRLVVVILASQVLFVLGALLLVVLTPRGMEQPSRDPRTVGGIKRQLHELNYHQQLRYTSRSSNLNTSCNAF